MRILSTAGQAAIASGNVSLALLFELDLDGGGLYLNQSRLDLVINGRTYAGTHGLGQVGEIVDKSAEMPRLSFSISGVPAAKVALALSEPVQGRAVRVLLAVFDSATGAVLDVVKRFAGWVNVMALADGRESATINITVESGTRDLLRPCNVRYSHADQQLLAPGDMAWQFNADQVERRIVFPAREWFLKHRE